jgi:hypothetical protein
MPSYFLKGFSSAVGGLGCSSLSISLLSHLRPWADGRNIAVLGHDGRWRRVVGGAAVVVVGGEALGVESAEFPAEGGAIRGGEKTQHVDFVCIGGPVPLFHRVVLVIVRVLVGRRRFSRSSGESCSQHSSCQRSISSRTRQPKTRVSRDGCRTKPRASFAVLH